MNKPESTASIAEAPDKPLKEEVTGNGNNDDSCSGHGTGKCCGNHRTAHGCCGS